MSMSCHACAIDANSTAIASITYNEADGYSIKECRKIRTGIEDYCGPKQEKTINKLVSLLKKKQIESLVLSIHTPCFFPLDTLFSRSISDKTFDSHCRAEAAFLLSKPGNYTHDHIPYTLHSDQHPLRRHLLFYYPSNLLETLCNRLCTFCSITSATHYLMPMIQSIAATLQPFILLEIEHRYATFSAGSNGGLEYFSYWRLNHTSDAEYFALRELTFKRKYRQYPVYAAGNLASDKSYAERISNAAETAINPFDLVELYAIKHNAHSFCKSPTELKALSAALTNLYAQVPS